MLKMTKVLVLVGAVVAFGCGAALADAGIGAKWKAKKVIANLVTAYEGDPNNIKDTFNKPTQPKSDCIFKTGTIKIKAGKEASLKIVGMECPKGTPYNGSICAHTKALSTIANQELDKDNNVISDPNSTPPLECVSSGLHLEGKANYAAGAAQVLTCTDGKCKGTLAQVTSDPCPTVDKISQLLEVTVYDGGDLLDIPVSGSNLKTCCGEGEYVAGGIPALAPPCATSTQQPFAVMGTYLQGE